MLNPTFSRRRRAAEKTAADVYIYDTIPKKIRIQTNQILSDGIGPYYRFGNRTAASDLYDYIVKTMRRECGVHLLSYAETEAGELFKWMEEAAETDDWLDSAEMCLRAVDKFVRKHPGQFDGLEAKPDEVIDEFNARLKESSLGYQFVSGEMIRVDSMHMHSEVVLPALHLLREQRFAAAEKEYRSAHEAFRHSRLEDCITDCAKAFESVLKVIGSDRGWNIKDTDPSSKLIQAALD